jgi:hypothetical protein
MVLAHPFLTRKARIREKLRQAAKKKAAKQNRQVPPQDDAQSASTLLGSVGSSGPLEFVAKPLYVTRQIKVRLLSEVKNKRRRPR